MAGSFNHCDDDGEFTFDLIENMGDAYEACEEMYFIIRHLLSDAEIKSALAAFYKREDRGIPALRQDNETG